MSTTITTRDQLDALPMGARLVDRDGCVLVKEDANNYRDVAPDGLTYGPDEINGDYAENGESTFYPLTVA